MIIYDEDSDAYFATRHQCDGWPVTVDACDVPEGRQIKTVVGYSTVYADLDFETYSEAGYEYDEDARKWRFIANVPKGTKHGLAAVGAPAYSEHESTEVLSLAYNLKDGRGPQLWLPGFPPPQDLFDHIAAGKILEAWNDAFEYLIWKNVCVARMGWPPLPFWQLRDAAAKSLAHSLPGALKNAANAIDADAKKIDDGLRLINKFSKPRNPTKHDDRLRLKPEDEPEDGSKFYAYNLGDIKAEASVSSVLPDLDPDELQLFLLDKKINDRGVHIDAGALSDCTEIVAQAFEQYTRELQEITGGVVKSASEIDKISGWLGGQGLGVQSLDAERVESLLGKFDLFDLVTSGGDISKYHPVDLEIAHNLGGNPNAEACRRVLQIRSTLGSASIKKLYAIQRRLTRDGRLKDIFQYCGADRTGRFAGRGPQPHNLPKAGPPVRRCAVDSCGRHYAAALAACPWCGVQTAAGSAVEWTLAAAEDALRVIATRDLDTVERFFGDAVSAVSGCLRGLFCAGPGKDLLCSDYNAIEAVVLAALSGEEWRLEIFRTHGKIYEQSASDISGIPFADFIAYKETNGEHHPLRSKIGKVAELASGFQGSVGAWKQFGADEFFDNDDDILKAVRAWRAKSKNIVNFWYRIEETATRAIQHPEQCFAYRDITIGVTGDIMFIRLPSGRKLTYHQPRLHPDVTPYGKEVLKITYMGWNTDYKKGPKGWMRLDTYGGKLTENIVQATARDILAYSMLNAERAGYAVVLHVHDEIISEVDKGLGSIDELETIMKTVPPWAATWPINAAGGWRGHRYRKD